MGDLFGGSGGAGGGASVANTGGVGIGGGGAVQPLLQGGVNQGAVEGMGTSGLPPQIQQILNSSGGGGTGGTGGPPTGSGGAVSSFGETPFPAIPSLTAPGNFNAQQGGGGGGLFDQALGQDFSIEQLQTQQAISPQQAPGLQAAIDAALQLAQQQLDPGSQFAQFLSGPGNDLFGVGANFLGGVGQAQQGLLGLEDPSIVQGRIDALGQDIRTQLGETIGGAGGLLTQQALAGNLGGGRSEVATGIAGRGAVDAFAREAAGIRESAAGRRLQGLLGGAEAGRIGVTGSQDLFNLGLAPSVAEFSPLAALAQIIGDPKVLSQTLSQGLSQGVTGGEGTGALLGGGGSLLQGIADLAEFL